MTYSSNSYLTLEQMTVNAQYILDYLISQGWTKNAICGMLGNMQTESTINPGIWEGLDNTSPSNGFGLVQWTPSTNYTDWADANGYTHDSMDGQLQHILYEKANGLQWISTASYPMTFSQFALSTDTPENLAYAFLYDYERPASLDQPDRQTQARYWYDNLSASGGGGGGSPGSSTGVTITFGSSSNSQVIALLLGGTLKGW